MADKINESSVSKDTINGVPEKTFYKLNDEQKNMILSGYNDSKNKDKDGGWFGRIFGVNTKNASIHIAFIICIILLIFCGIDLFASFSENNGITSEVWNLVFPVVTLALGYIFGKGETK